MKIALLQSRVDHYYRIQHLINTLKIKNEVVEVYKIQDINIKQFDVLLIEYFSANTSDPHKEMCDRINSFKDELLKFKGKILFYNADDGQATYIAKLDEEIANRIDAWLVHMINENFLNDNLKIKNILLNKFVLYPRYTLPYAKSDDVVYENKENKIVFIGSTTGNYWFNGKNWRVEALKKIWDNKFLKESFDGWLVNDNIIDVARQDEEYNKTFKFVQKGHYLSEFNWYTKLKNSTLSLCLPGHTRYTYRHPQSMNFKCVMLANFDLEYDPFKWLFSEKLKNISYTVNSDLSNLESVCEEALLNKDKTKAYAFESYDIYKRYFEPTDKDTYQSHVWELVINKLNSLNIYDL